MNQSRVKSTVIVVVLVVALTVVVMAAGCGAGDPYVGSWGSTLSIKKSGDTYFIHDLGNPFGSDYQGKVVNGKLVTQDGVHAATFVIEGNWLVDVDGHMKFEKD